MIYIESDDHLESITESQNQDGVDEFIRNAAEVMQKPVGKSTDSGSLIQGETGTTVPSGGSNANASNLVAASYGQGA